MCSKVFKSVDFKFDVHISKFCIQDDETKVSQNEIIPND